MSLPAKSAICLGCGCVCDDVLVAVSSRQVVPVENICSVGTAWFRDGVFPSQLMHEGVAVTPEAAYAAAVALLFERPQRTLIYVADDVSCTAQSAAVALADQVGATVDGAASDTVGEGLRAAQRRGRASATLGELKHRADVVLFWGVDPASRYPRFIERFVEEPPRFASSRTCVAVDVDASCGPAGCNERISVSGTNEVEALNVLRAALQDRLVSRVTDEMTPFIGLAQRLKAAAKYIAIVFDAEPGQPVGDADRAEALIAFTQALNVGTRAALFALRAGGNRNGIESLLTWQTGYPFAVDLSRGYPQYCEESSAQRLYRGRYDAALIVGSTDKLPAAMKTELRKLPTVVVGPAASESDLSARVTIDTGVVGIHEGGLILRMDDVPLEARPLLSHPHSLAAVLETLAAHAAAKSVSTR